MTLKEAITIFMLADRAKSTAYTYGRFLNRFADYIGPSRPIDEIRLEDLELYVHHLRTMTTKYAEHPSRPTEAEPLSSVTVYKYVKMIKLFFHWCVKRGYLSVSPTQHLVSKKPVRPIGQGKAITEEEFQALLQVAGTTRNWAILLMLAHSGVRAGELCRLKIRDVYLAIEEASVDGKGDKQRQIYYTPTAAKALTAWLAERPNVPHNCVFCSSKDGRPLTPSGLSQIIRRLCKKAGLKRKLGAHAFRHYVGKRFGHEHVPVRTAQAYLGHSDPSITYGYYQDVDEEDLHRAAQLLDFPEAQQKKTDDNKIIPLFPAS